MFRGDNDHFIVVRPVATSNDVGIYINSVGGQVGFHQYGSATLNGFPNDNKWHQLAVVGNSTVHTLYIDGVASGSYAMSYVSDTLRAIGNWQGGGQAFASQIDEFVLYASQLSAARIKSLYDSYNATACTCSGGKGNMDSERERERDEHAGALLQSMHSVRVYLCATLGICSGGVVERVLFCVENF
jgi:hypothetical protein